MPAKPAAITLIFAFLYFSSSLALAEPIGSIKHLLNKNNPQNVSPKIARSQFTTAVINREPTDDVVMLSNNSSKIYYFSELSNLKGHNIAHRWLHQGKIMAEIKFNVKSDRWRVFSSKKINPNWTGEWSVVLVDEKGTLLQTSKLEVVDAKNN